MWIKLASLLLALLKALPPLLKAVEEQQARERETSAGRRHAAKDAAVDAGIAAAMQISNPNLPNPKLSVPAEIGAPFDEELPRP